MRCILVRSRIHIENIFGAVVLLVVLVLLVGEVTGLETV